MAATACRVGGGWRMNTETTYAEVNFLVALLQSPVGVACFENAVPGTPHGQSRNVWRCNVTKHVVRRRIVERLAAINCPGGTVTLWRLLDRGKARRRFDRQSEKLTDEFLGLTKNPQAAATAAGDELITHPNEKGTSDATN